MQPFLTKAFPKKKPKPLVDPHMGGLVGKAYTKAVQQSNDRNFGAARASKNIKNGARIAQQYMDKLKAAGKAKASHPKAHSPSGKPGPSRPALGRAHSGGVRNGPGSAGGMSKHLPGGKLRVSNSGGLKMKHGVPKTPTLRQSVDHVIARGKLKGLTLNRKTARATVFRRATDGKTSKWNYEANAKSGSRFNPSNGKKKAKPTPSVVTKPGKPSDAGNASSSDNYGGPQSMPAVPKVAKTPIKKKSKK